MATKLKISDRLKNFGKKLKSLAPKIKNEVKLKSQEEAQKVINIFNRGIRNSKLNLTSLRPRTISRKQSKGYSRPSNPLFATGDYSEMLIIEETKNRLVVKPRQGTHNSGLSYRDILDVHEKGRTIRIGKRIIRIPARPALKNARRIARAGRKPGRIRKLIKKLIK